MKKVKKLIIILLIASIFGSIAAVNASATGDTAYGAATVGTSNLNLRTGPSMSDTVIETLDESNIVVVLERTNDEWYLVNFQGLVGYVNVSYLRDILTAENFSAIGRITGDTVNIRERPTADSELLATYPGETEMTVIGINSGWYKVNHEGHTGYVRSDYMEIIKGTRASVDPSETLAEYVSVDESAPVPAAPYAPPANLTLGAQIADYGLSFLGSSYVYGGASPSGFDCSGFVQYVYKYFGIGITRVAHDQFVKEGVAVDKENLAPGDLVFFASGGGSYVTHVGLYIGNSEFVHASSHSTGVIVSRLDSAYYTSVWHGAKRLI